MRRSVFIRRIYTGLLAAIVAVSTIMGNALCVIAAPIDNPVESSADSRVLNSADSIYVNAEAVDNLKVAKDLFTEYKEAVLVNDPENIQTVLNKAAKLTPTQRVHFFLLIYRDYYKNNYLSDSFPYFNVDAYIAAYPEVAAKYSNLTGNELREAVLSDYIEHGIFEGKSSCTDFDPIVAVLAYPDETLSAMAMGIVDPQAGIAAIFDAYAKAEGSTSTRHYMVLSDSLGDKIVGLVGDGSNYNNIFLVKTIEALNTTGAESQSEIEHKSEDTRNDSPCTPEKPDNPEDPENPEDPDDPVDPVDPEDPDDPVDPVDPVDPDEDKVKYEPLNHKASKTVVEVPDLYSNLKTGVYNEITSGKTRKPKAKTTVILYMFGTDLETNNGLVTNSINELLTQGYNTDELNIVVLAGATQTYANDWMNNNSANYNCSYYYVDPKSVNKDAVSINSSTLKLLGEYGTADFGSSGLLAGMIDMSADLFSADSYMLILNDHGGGVNSGIGSLDQKALDANQTALNMYELEEALGSSKFIRDGNIFDMIGFDACLMGGIEVAYNVSKYGKYMIASEETEYNSWNYADFIKEVTKEQSIRDAAVSMASRFNAYDRGNLNTIHNYSVYNLEEIGATVSALNESGDYLNRLLTYNPINKDDSDSIKTELYRDMYYAMRKARAKSYSNGGSDKTNLFEYADVNEYMSNLSVSIQEIADKWKDKGVDGKAIETLVNECKSSIDKLLSCSALEYSGMNYAGEVISSVDTLKSNGEKYTYSQLAEMMMSSNPNAWKAIKNSAMCGTSIYMPYYSAKIEKNEDTIISDARYVSYEEQALIEKYTELVKNYVTIKNSDENAQRIARLKRALAKDNAYTDLFGQVSENEVTANNRTLSYINIPITKEYTDEKLKAELENDAQYNPSINPYTDFTEVVSGIKLYTIMNQAITTEAGGTDYVDLVVGQVTLNNDAVNGAAESINIVLANQKYYQVVGNVAGDADAAPDRKASEYAIIQTISNQEAVLKTFFPDQDVSDWILFAGQATAMAETEGTEDAPDTKNITEETYDGCYAVYSLSATAGQWSFVGMLQQVPQQDNEYAYASIKNASSFRFDQYVAGESEGAYVKSEPATEASWKFLVGDNAPVIYERTIIQDIELKDIKKYEVEIVLDLENEDGQMQVSYVATVGSIDYDKDSSINNTFVEIASNEAESETEDSSSQPSENTDSEVPTQEEQTPPEEQTPTEEEIQNPSEEEPVNEQEQEQEQQQMPQDTMPPVEPSVNEQPENNDPPVTTDSSDNTGNSSDNNNDPDSQSEAA